MTYRDLLEKLQNMSADDLECDVIVYSCEEAMYVNNDHLPITSMVYSGKDNNVLDVGHPMLLNYEETCKPSLDFWYC